MDPEDVYRILEQVAGGSLSPSQALERLRLLPYEDLGFATLDTHRALRTGLPEVVFCAGKTEDQVAQIVARLASRHARVLGTRATPQQFRAASALTPDLNYDPVARALWLDREPQRPRKPGVVIVTAGTADEPVAAEAALTLRLFGHEAAWICDVGVAGLHRLRPHLPTLAEATVVIVVAGMEGALPSVVGGLVSAPVVAVPTSVGYGAGAGGFAALLAMLSACAPGVSVVNVDNGFGAAVVAARINERAQA